MGLRSVEANVITRRDVVTGGIVAGALGAGPEETLAEAPVLQRDSDEKVASLLTEIRDELRRGRGKCNVNDCPDVERVRNEQRTFLKGRNRFPDYVDVGADVWDRLCDWHIERLLPLQVSRLPDGRYAMPFFQTFVVLRADVANSYVSQGYDK
jgi:hypothetical protein